MPEPSAALPSASAPSSSVPSAPPPAAPVLEALLRRLAETPPEFLTEPRLGKVGEVQVDAVVTDLLLDLGLRRIDAAAMTALAARFAPTDKAERNRLRSVLIACWLLADAAFAGRAEAALAWLSGPAWDELARLVDAEDWVRHDERREELVRLALAACGLLAAGESAAQATDRLSAISSAQRQAAVAAARKAEDRARQVREEMLRKRAEEAAAKTSRE